MMRASGLQACDWFHGNLARAPAVARLLTVSSRSGDFLVRESASKDGFLVVSVNRKGAVRHFLVNGAPGSWWVSEEQRARPFASVQELIAHYVALGPELGLGSPALAAAASAAVSSVITASEGQCCPQCSAALRANGLFCQRCGARVGTAPEYVPIPWGATTFFN